MKIFRVGTLSYTSKELVVLFAWLLWGDFVFNFMETVLPSLLPVLLKQHGATSGEIAVIVSTIFMVLNGLLNPVISYQSDRFRSRWGRRRPFIFATTPFVVLFLCAIPYAPDVTQALLKSAVFVKLMGASIIAPVILMFGVLVAGFQVFNLFISSLYYYLIPDVVPREQLGKFYALFRVFGTLAGVAFNFFMFGWAETHMREIFVGSALAYGVFITLMCWRVKEGDYPPARHSSHLGWWRTVAVYIRECFGTSHYWWVFLAYGSLNWALAGNVFALFFHTDELGISLDQFGKMTAWGGICFMIIAYPFGALTDRVGSHRMLLSMMALLAVSSFAAFFLAVNLGSAFFWAIVRGAISILASATLLRWTVDVYPNDRYGQFGSAGALFSSAGGAVLGPICGWLVDAMGSYRYFLIWNVGFAFLGFIAATVVYRQSQLLNKSRSLNSFGPDRLPNL